STRQFMPAWREGVPPPGLQLIHGLPERVLCQAGEREAPRPVDRALYAGDQGDREGDRQALFLPLSPLLGIWIRPPWCEVPRNYSVQRVHTYRLACRHIQAFPSCLMTSPARAR